MAAPYSRNSLICPFSEDFELAEADDIDRSEGTSGVDITGASRLLIIQVADGTAGTAGIDVIEYSYDGGYEWSTADDLVALYSADDATALTGGALNAAGVEPTGLAVFKGGPYVGPVKVRVAPASGSSTAWVTGAPSVDAIVVGLQRDALTAATA